MTVAPSPSTPGTVVTVTGSDGTVARREVLAAGSYLSSEDDRVNVGLGQQTIVAQVRVEWPDGTVVELGEIDVDQVLTVPHR